MIFPCLRETGMDKLWNYRKHPRFCPWQQFVYELFLCCVYILSAFIYDYDNSKSNLRTILELFYVVKSLTKTKSASI